MKCLSLAQEVRKLWEGERVKKMVPWSTSAQDLDEHKVRTRAELVGRTPRDIRALHEQQKDVQPWFTCGGLGSHWHFGEIPEQQQEGCQAM
jgi:hypothetical protein